MAPGFLYQSIEAGMTAKRNAITMPEHVPSKTELPVIFIDTFVPAVTTSYPLTLNRRSADWPKPVNAWTFASKLLAFI